MWLAHALTLIRIPLAIALWWTWGWPAIALVTIAAASDVADGNVARWMQRHGHTRPAIGGWLDPLVDKLFVAIAVAAMWAHTHATGVLALVATRELLFVPLFAIYMLRGQRTRPLHADPIGKATTIAQFVALAAILADASWAFAVALVAAVLGAATIVHYIASAVTARRRGP
jgi:phosphatidylglycerophosphate synthase